MLDMYLILELNAGALKKFIIYDVTEVVQLDQKLIQGKEKDLGPQKVILNVEQHAHPLSE